jgi:hypothetical protein
MATWACNGLVCDLRRPVPALNGHCVCSVVPGIGYWLHENHLHNASRLKVSRSLALVDCIGT